MLTERYRNMMGSIKLTEGERARILGRVLAAGQARRPVHRLPAMAVALCACLTLGLAAFAAVYKAGGFESIALLANGDGQDGYGLYGGEYQLLPVESLSDGVLAMAAKGVPGEETKYFMGQDWSAAAAYSGVSLPENPMLDGLDIGGCFLAVSSNGEGPTRLCFQQWTQGLDVSVSAEAYTELMGTADFMVERYYIPGDTLTADTYTAESGLSAAIVHVLPGNGARDEVRYPEDKERYVADFLLDSFRYHIEVKAREEDPAQALELLHSILEGFAC